ncbi:MAG: LuxR C-terminal-related transcriptional regulator [Pseudomonadota bacterium]
MNEVNRISKLTEREREVLRLWLERKTAKEIAMDLSISHHAVEKRLKMARAKLGVASSLEAARLLSEAEGYQPMAAQPPDLAAMHMPSQDANSHARKIGVVIVILLAAAAALAVQSTSPSQTYGALPDSGAGEDVGYQGVLDEDMIRPTEAQSAVITRTTFEFLDEDRSGFLEGRESPVSAPSKPQSLPTKNEEGNVIGTEKRLMTQKQATDGFYARADTDGDGRVSYAEYHAWSRPTLQRIGVPKTWIANLEPAPAPQDARLSAMTRRTFNGLDENGSGFLEDPESPFVKTLILEKGRVVDEDLALALAEEINGTPDPEKSAQFYAEADRDGDGRVSYAEFHTWSVPRIAELGLDLIEAMKP